jgi:hypothetical protein
LIVPPVEAIATQLFPGSGSEAPFAVQFKPPSWLPPLCMTAPGGQHV